MSARTSVPEGRHVQMAATVAVAMATMLGTAAPASAFLFWREEAPRYQYVEPPEPAPQRRKRTHLPKPARALSAAQQAHNDAVLAKAKGKLLQAVISLDFQQLTLYADGEEIARSPVSTGTRTHATPTGLFSVIQKRRHHKSNLYSNAPMPYMQRITWSGVALHQGMLPGYPASHGCVRLPESFARLMWSATRTGARVVIAREPVAPQSFAHAGLFTAKPKPAPDAKPDGKSDDAPQAGAPVAPRPSDSHDKVKLAEAATTTTDGPPVPGELRATPPNETPGAAPAEKPLPPGPISVFVSRKEQKLFVRKGFEPILEAPVKIERADEPLGTHLFTALADEGGGLRWVALTMPERAAAQPPATTGRRGKRPTDDLSQMSDVPDSMPPRDAAAALDRVTIPPETVERISELMSAGVSYIVSDQGLGPETGRGTDFIVLTR